MDTCLVAQIILNGASRLSRNPLFFCRGFKIASSVTEVGVSERFKSIFILKDMIPHIKNRVSKSPLDFLDTLKPLE